MILALKWPFWALLCDLAHFGLFLKCMLSSSACRPRVHAIPECTSTSSVALPPASWGHGGPRSILALKWPFLPSLCDFSPKVAIFALALWPSVCDFGPCSVQLGPCMTFWSSDGYDEEREVERGWRLHGAYPQRGLSL